MIYTVTLNPSIDYIVRMDSELKPGYTNRSCSEDYLIGGKGNNVSTVLKELGFDSVALGFAAGFTGEAIIRGLDNKGIKNDYCFLKKGNSRINIKLKETGNVETEINANGPEIDSDELKEFFDKLKKIKDGDILVLAGSIPKSLPSSIYEDILEKISDRNVLAVVDAAGQLLKDVLKHKPFLIKPNRQELSELFDIHLSSDEDIDLCAEKLRTMGAVNVLVSLGSDGARLYAADGNVYSQSAIKGKAINTVGAGDSMVAGFLAGYLKYDDYEKALRLGSCAGAATAFSEDLADIDLIKKLEEDNGWSE